MGSPFMLLPFSLNVRPGFMAFRLFFLKLAFLF